MNRPTYKKFSAKGMDREDVLLEQCDRLLKYTNDLEKHCDGLEKELSETFNQHLESLINIKDKKIVELEKALDKACKELAMISDCYECGRRNECLRKNDEDSCTEDEWKEWLLK